MNYQNFYKKDLVLNLDNLATTTPKPKSILTDFAPLNYINSHGDFINTIGTNTEAAKTH